MRTWLHQCKSISALTVTVEFIGLLEACILLTPYFKVHPSLLASFFLLTYSAFLFLTFLFVPCPSVPFPIFSWLQLLSKPRNFKWKHSCPTMEGYICPRKKIQYANLLLLYSKIIYPRIFPPWCHPQTSFSFFFLKFRKFISVHFQKFGGAILLNSVWNTFTQWLQSKRVR